MEVSRMDKVKGLLALLVLLASSSVLAGPAVYEVSAEIRQGGQVVATPTIRVKPGAPAEVSVSGENGYTLAVSVSPVDDGVVDVAINVGTSLASLRSTVATLVGKPIVVSTGDIAVSVTVSDDGD
jgi:hypothetical protein